MSNFGPMLPNGRNVSPETYRALMKKEVEIEKEREKKLGGITVKIGPGFKLKMKGKEK